MFAQITCDDLELPTSFKSAFVQQVKTQISEYTNHRTEHPTLAEGVVPKAIATTSASPKCGELDEEDELWWARWRKRVRMDEGGSFVGVGSSTESAPVDAATAAANDAKAMPPPSSITMPSNGNKRKVSSLGAHKPVSNSSASKNVQIVVVEDDEEHNHEMRVLIKLDITVGSVQLTDQFEWDVTDLDASPEHFAEIYAGDVGLSGEFA